jgi:hypothetical protein
MKKIVRLRATACAAITVGAFVLAALLSTPAEVRGVGGPVHGDSFVLLLKGIYEPVVRGPNLGLSLVDLNDGSYSKCDIYRVSGLPGTTDQAVGTFWVNFDVTLCAYRLPGGAFSAVVTEFLSELVEIDGELYQIGTAELVIPEATGIYRSFVGGAIHMEFVTHVIDEVTFDEHCFCFISRS